MGFFDFLLKRPEPVPGSSAIHLDEGKMLDAESKRAQQIANEQIQTTKPKKALLGVGLLDK